MSTQELAPPNPKLDAPAPQERTVRAWLRRRGSGSTTWIFLGLVAMVAVFAVLRFDEFMSVPNIRNVATDASILLVVAVGMTFVIATAGIDLSVGSVLVFSGVVGGELMEALGGTAWYVGWLGLAAAVAAGAAWGVANGVLVAKAKVPPFIVTLGTLGMALGCAQLITNAIDVRVLPVGMVDTIGFGRLFGSIPYLVIIAAVVSAGGGFALAATRFGRYTLAIGSNPEAARRAGINVDRHLIKVYGITGTLAGFAGFLSLARFSTTSIGGHTTDNLQSIAAVVLGGTSLFGGVATVAGTVVGVFIPATLQNGFVIVGIQPFWQNVAVGAVLILAVYVDQLKRRSASSSTEAKK